MDDLIALRTHMGAHHGCHWGASTDEQVVEGHTLLHGWGARAEDRDHATAWQTLTEAVEQAERDDPAVAEAAARLDAAIDDLNYQAALRRFRPLPWERTDG